MIEEINEFIMNFYESFGFGGIIIVFIVLFIMYRYKDYILDLFGKVPKR